MCVAARRRGRPSVGDAGDAQQQPHGVRLRVLRRQLEEAQSKGARFVVATGAGVDVGEHAQSLDVVGVLQQQLLQRALGTQTVVRLQRELGFATERGVGAGADALAGEGGGVDASRAVDDQSVLSIRPMRAPATARSSAARSGLARVARAFSSSAARASGPAARRFSMDSGWS
jgi:hypothetical protein